MDVAAYSVPRASVSMVCAAAGGWVVVPRPNAPLGFRKCGQGEQTGAA